MVNSEILEPKAGRSRVRIDYTGDDDGVSAINQKIASEGIAVSRLQRRNQGSRSNVHARDERHGDLTMELIGVYPTFIQYGQLRTNRNGRRRCIRSVS